MTTVDSSRRRFLHDSGAAIGAGWLASQWPAVLAAAEHAAAAHHAGRGLVFLEAAEAADFEAIAARILPATETPGARELGVIHFMDQALAGFMGGTEQLLRPQLAALNDTVRQRYRAERFHELDDDAQDALLAQIDDQPFFRTMRTVTLMGAFALPAYGGNRNHLGFALLGFDHRHLWRPPFGYYDAARHGSGSAPSDPAAPGGGHAPQDAAAGAAGGSTQHGS